MEFILLEIVLFGHFQSLALCEVTINMWRGHLLYLEWDGVTFVWDFLFLNAEILKSLG